ncbi:Nin one binding Zn-ribbon like-domain-containing protein [Desarmillaria tabescens]|uniref:20S-pre-rRNA D-site endonuclease NOB1 n=1 Tax=Armillaria tabescens TaxID=1929756 RepID=A0AA39NAE1_ARMTA|nr:Nin one binding Zn-ribbon like-domain-containing protein [Desarmillaria tabescens]KAK0462002.1 Nin one binding Zn-ribbon like-domain-containing protein [Desarmillaria tabescens]
MANDKPKCKSLVLDAGPLLSLSPLRGLAETYVTAPQIIEELRDKNTREHLERLGLNYGVKIEVKNPSATSLATVIQWAKKTGDYSVLSHPDLCVLALTHTLHEKAKLEKVNQELEVNNDLTDAPGDDDGSRDPLDASEPPPSDTESESQDEEQSERKDAQDLEPLDVELQPISTANPPPQHPPSKESEGMPAPLYDDPSDEDDGEGEWITPANVAIHKSRALDLLPSSDSSRRKGKKKADEMISVGCMTADFAMQNVLLQMGLNLVGTEGRRIQKVKSWVLRCHACFKICKDSSKKFCPSCGNPSLLRASVTISDPSASPDTPAMQVHLKPNFQYRIRGTKYSIPAPKAGSAKTGPGEGLILREDQAEYMRAKKRADGKREREEAKMMKGLLARGARGDTGVAVGSWMDPDWIPEIMSAGTGGKGRSMRSAGMDGDMPIIGYGKKNPNERRRRK